MLVGFSLGGFFDGILLHQILQWHHLLSDVDALKDMRTQILADGLFHALMYVVAVMGLTRLWRRRAVLSTRDADRILSGHALMGFGIWHIVDGVFSHWVTGIHRIKPDAATPLLWDLGWFFVFGVLPAVAGWYMRRRTPGDGGRHGRAAAATLGVAAALAGPIAALPDRGGDASDPVMVMFAPGVGGAAAFNALAKVDARVLWVDRSGGLWAVSMKDRRDAWKLYASGAMLVANSRVAFGCFSWTQVPSAGSAFLAPRAPLRFT